MSRAAIAAKWPLRGRWRWRQVNAHVGRYGRHAARLYGTSLLLAEGMARSLAHADAPAPEVLQSKLTALSSVLRQISLTGWSKDAAQASSLAQVGVAMQADVFAQLPPGAAGRWWPCWTPKQKAKAQPNGMCNLACLHWRAANTVLAVRVVRVKALQIAGFFDKGLERFAPDWDNHAF